VLFTEPATGELTLYGDVLFDAQGEDVVAGPTRPSRSRPSTRLPAVRPTSGHAVRLERHFADLCDIEFTIEEGRLWMLQVRVGKRSPQAALRIAVDMAEDESFPVTRAIAERVAGLLNRPPTTTSVRSGFVLPLATGLPASPGMASGPIVTTPEAALEAAEAGPAAILVRVETSPDDVHGMARAAGILTSRGGLASHAAVVARGWGIPAVVGAAGIEVRDGQVVVGERILRPGDVLTIDGSSGEVFEERSSPLRRSRRGANAAHVGNGARSDRGRRGRRSSSVPGGRVTPDDCLRAIAIKGFAPVEGVADAVLSTADVVRPILTSSSSMAGGDRRRRLSTHRGGHGPRRHAAGRRAGRLGCSIAPSRRSIPSSSSISG
jgi:phosphohistidine swiveling domain-containing protein